MANASPGRRQAEELICDDDSSKEHAAKKLKAIALPAIDEAAKEENDQNENLEKQCGGGEVPNGKPLSKNAQKRLLKLEKMAQKKKDMKAREKERKKERKEKKSQEWANLSTEEKEAAIQRSKEASRVRAEENNRRKEKLNKALEAGQNLVIDFQFSDQMTDQEIANMSQQIMYCYAANARAPVSVRLSLTSLGRMKQYLENVPGYQNWKLHREETSYMEVFATRTQDLVYLTADSETILESLDDSKIYIIGGVVDHNRLKCLTLNKAKEQGIATARLPIQENVKLTTSTVLTVNQVVEIILEYLDSKDWVKALTSIIPQRKVAQ
ncbi:tRNA (guanine(9)-N1)-methyltransferase [Selaginella moellendorffii]|uniref:tRNA (guanine(9)-N1)-methyltransferase n=1 Tax=Selaginella moellendorffii TaxID=88036 RepID=UPI000D1C67BB|nr:tRNA (guanine(9)-N1)-methyltransferase [Selaginella moellendorffii]|eukprot:XP_002963803.2 tRNA (guanine(9)-N1)-methyltransferase [Selaginella moellendorffii]